MYRWSLICLLTLAIPVPCPAAEPAGFQAEVKIQKPTRLDVDFVAASFGDAAGKVPSDYLSYRQRYQLFVPADYDEKKAASLLVFISPGDDPLGWRSWQKVCEERGVFFCAVYGAGNNQPPALRVRLVLDMLDDVRRHYRVDPEQTYFAGLGDGGRLASALAYGLPELCGGVVLIGATPVSPRLPYLRQRLQDRLSAAFVIGEQDGKRREVEDNWNPYYRDLGIRARLWSMKGGHELPAAEMLVEVYAWLAEDAPRRRKDLEAHPKLAVEPGEALDGPAQAARLLETAQADVVQPGQLYRGITLMQGIEARWPKTESADKAHLLIREIQIDQHLKQLLAEQSAAEEQRDLAAQARARERLGDLGGAVAVYEKLAVNHAASDAGKKAVEESKRLKEKLAATPYLGIAFEDDGVTIHAVATNGPAERAGLRAGDRFVQMAAVKVDSIADVRRALQALKPGDKTMVEIRRDAKTMMIPLEIAATPVRSSP